MESLDDFYRRRRMADEAASARREWETKSLEMAGSGEAFEVAGGLDDDRLLGSDSGSTAATESPPLRFYDAGPDGNLVPDRVHTPFSAWFSRDNATQIGLLCDVPNPFYGVRDHVFQTLARYHTADGRLLAELPFAPPVPASYSRLAYYHSFGGRIPGVWPRGDYFVDIFIDGHFVVRGSFTIG
jgi:hypothetical protein